MNRYERHLKERKLNPRAGALILASELRDGECWRLAHTSRYYVRTVCSSDGESKLYSDEFDSAGNKIRGYVWIAPTSTVAVIDKGVMP